MSSPLCGNPNSAAASSVSVWSILSGVGGVLLAILAAWLHFKYIPDAGWFQSFITGVTGVPASTMGPYLVYGGAAVVAAAVVAAAVIIIWLWSNYASLTNVPVGVQACVAGVIDQLQGPNFSIFSLAHGFIFVVVKKTYWPLVTGAGGISGNKPTFVWCEQCKNCPQSEWPPDSGASGNCSPMLPCVYYSQAVVNVATGEAIGGTVGAAVGAFLGSIAGIAVIAALGCAATAVFSLICLLVVLLAVLIAVAIVAAVALIGGATGAAVGAATSSDAQPSGDLGAEGGPSVTLSVGDYVMVTGNFTTIQNLNGSNAIYFAGWIPNATTNTVVNETQSNGNGTTVFGFSTGAAPFCHDDPDMNIPDSADASCLSSNS